MKNKALHVFPLQTTFLKKIKAGVQYYNDNHYTNFDINSLEIKTFHAFAEDQSWPADSIFTKALKTISIHNQKYLTKLKITVENSSLFQRSTIRNFCFSLAAHFKTLHQLDIHFLSCRKLNRENLRYLLDSLKGMKGLAEINLYFLGYSDIDDQCLEDIKMSLLKKSKKLQRFKVLIEGRIVSRWDKGNLYFEPNLDERLQNYNITTGDDNDDWDPNKITRKGGRSLCRGIARYLEKLKSFAFKMTTSIDYDRELAKEIARMIAPLKNLEDLNFSIPEYTDIDDEFLAELISSIAQLKKLQSLSLDFTITTLITERGYKLLARTLSSLSQLTYFALNVQSCRELTDVLVKRIGINITQNLKNLRTLILSFWGNQLTDKALLELTKNISRGLPLLKKLILKFAWCEVVNKGFPLILPEQIKEFDLYLSNPQLMIHETWENLNRLSLSFDDCKEKTSFVDYFFESSFPLENLNELRLIYCKTKKVQNRQIRNLATEIRINFKNLTSLELGFYDCPLLTSDALLFLGDRIGTKLKKLRHLNFTLTSSDSLYYNSSLVAGAVVSLADSIISRFENLESLALSFYRLMDEEENMEQMIDRLCSKISQSSKNLKKVSLMFRFFETFEIKRKIREKLCHIPILEI